MSSCFIHNFQYWWSHEIFMKNWSEVYMNFINSNNATRVLRIDG